MAEKNKKISGMGSPIPHHSNMGGVVVWDSYPLVHRYALRGQIWGKYGYLLMLFIDCQSVIVSYLYLL